LPEATSDTRILAKCAGRILRRIYRPGFGYHKAGVMLLDLRPAANRQFSLHDGAEGKGGTRSDKLMVILDSINKRYGRGALRLAAEGVDRTWRMRRGNLSPCYTTDWAGLAVVTAR
jgi:DNA polymerase V